MFGLKVPELLIIFGVLLLLFGARRLPELGRSLGSALRDFKRHVSGLDAVEAPVELASRKSPDA